MRSNEFISETIGPHEGNELNLMLNHGKPAATTDAANFPKWKSHIKQHGWTVKFYHTFNGMDRMIVAKDPLVAEEIKHLIYSRKSPYDKNYHIRLGKLLGYTDDDIAHFLRKIDLHSS